MRAGVENLLGSLFRDGPYEKCPRLAQSARSPVDQSNLVFLPVERIQTPIWASRRFHWVFSITDIALDADEHFAFGVHDGVWLSQGQSRACHVGYFVAVRSRRLTRRDNQHRKYLARVNQSRK
jgi:hypothetical protein